MKQKMWKTCCVVLIVAAFFMGTAAGCGNQNQTETQQYKVGIVQALADYGLVEGENVTFVQRNGQNEQSNLESIVQTFINEDVDLICAGSRASYYAN